MTMVWFLKDIYIKIPPSKCLFLPKASWVFVLFFQVEINSCLGWISPIALKCLTILIISGSNQHLSSGRPWLMKMLACHLLRFLSNKVGTAKTLWQIVSCQNLHRPSILASPADQRLWGWPFALWMAGSARVCGKREPPVPSWCPWFRKLIIHAIRHQQCNDFYVCRIVRLRKQRPGLSERAVEGMMD